MHIIVMYTEFGYLRPMMGLPHGPDGPSPPELLARTGQANMADHMRRHRVRWLGHAADRLPTRLGEPSTAPGHVEEGGQPVLSFE